MLVFRSTIAGMEEYGSQMSLTVARLQRRVGRLDLQAKIAGEERYAEAIELEATVLCQSSRVATMYSLAEATRRRCAAMGASDHL